MAVVADPSDRQVGNLRAERDRVDQPAALGRSSEQIDPFAVATEREAEMDVGIAGFLVGVKQQELARPQHRARGEDELRPRGVVADAHAGEIHLAGAVVEEFDHVGEGALVIDGRVIAGEHFVDPHPGQGRIDGPGLRGGSLGLGLPDAGRVLADHVNGVIPGSKPGQFNGVVHRGLVAPRTLIQAILVVRDGSVMARGNAGNVDGQCGVGLGSHGVRLAENGSPAGDHRAHVQAVGAGAQGGRAGQQAEVARGGICQASIPSDVPYAVAVPLGGKERMVDR